ncbi:TAXI family TRAP transporter solute-binding subunit [Zwartia panacis]|uniref:TAXI family TRAP transporter solute-binding subunit n=1 Tax=Zwartia panacis TaxID=2683345 RepID=UPI0025B41E65|nr:TAXI family TRAP transporter solute-binding subunit [Zwartia panacis]MDN4016367.1 TAXI family TRAP transporter solute-binding subunit [Zwartia panacis]
MKLIKTLALSFAVVCAGAAHAQNYSIATGGTGGVYYPMGGGLASVLTKKVPGMSATAEVTGGSVDNLKLIGSGKPYMAFTMSDAAKDALDGKDKFSGRKVDVKTLLVLYPNRMHVVTTEASGIKTMKDLKGKRVSTGSPGSATEVMAFRLLEASGLDKDKDVKRERLGVAESVNAVKDRKIDAFFWVGGLPTAAVTDLANTPGTKIVMIDHADAVDAMNKKYGNLYFKDTIPQSTYSGMAGDNKNASVSNILVVNGQMPEEEAYKITKAVFDNKEELVRTHREYESVKLENQKAAATPLPFHPGALKYFQEKGQNVN